MPTPFPLYASASEIAAQLTDGTVTSVEIAEALLKRLDTVNGKVHAVISHDPADILAQAKASDERRARGESLGPLDGIPVGIKDVIAVSDQPLTCASRMLENFRSPYDATATTRLRAAGAILFGRLNMDEFAMGSSTENSAVGPTLNPWDTTRIPGGSSGGSAAAIAAGIVPLTLGSDTGGSIRQPAALCGVVGLKPTYGRVSRYGLVAFASSLDQIGPMAHSVEDVALLLEAIAGHDPLDSTSAREPLPQISQQLKNALPPRRIGIPKEYFAEGMAPQVRREVEKAISFYRSQGCEIVEVSLPHTELAVPVYYIVATAEASSNLARYDGVRYGHRSPDASDAINLYYKSRGEGFGSEVKRRIILGTYVLSSGYYDAWYGRAQKVRKLIQNDFLKAFEEVDLLLAPVTPNSAFKLGEKKNDPLSMYLEDIYTIAVNLAGLPAISLPCGFTDDHLPVGFQLIAPPFAENELLQAAHLFDRQRAPETRIAPIA